LNKKYFNWLTIKFLIIRLLIADQPSHPARSRHREDISCSIRNTNTSCFKLATFCATGTSVWRLTTSDSDREPAKFSWTMSTVEETKHCCQTVNIVHGVNTTAFTVKTCQSCASTICLLQVRL